MKFSEISHIHKWTLHVSRPDDEWESLCKTSKPEFLTDNPQSALPGYEICGECLESFTKNNSSL